MMTSGLILKTNTFLLTRRKIKLFSNIVANASLKILSSLGPKKKSSEKKIPTVTLSYGTLSTMLAHPPPPPPPPKKKFKRPV